MKDKYKVCSLFAGIGGIDLAFQQAGFEIVWANELDSDACKTYRYNFQNTVLTEGDIRKINADDIPDFYILTAGFPCQSFSVCGNRKGFADERGNLFFEIMRIVDAKKPKIIFLENVANLTEHDNGKTFNRIHNELSDRDYYIRYLIADACNYGIPQHRTRTYIVAFKDFDMCNKFQFPKEQPLKKHIFDIIDRSVKADKNFYLNENSVQYQKMKNAITDENQIYRFSDYGIQKSKDEISFTLKANMGTWYNRVPIIKDNFGIRTITPQECLALQGFPKSFDFPDIPIKSMYKQCGNTVVVPVVKKYCKTNERSRYIQMKFEKITIKNFRNFENVNIDLSNKNIFFGLNDVGKTNFLYALRYVFDKDIRKQNLTESDFHNKQYDKPIEIIITIDISDIHNSDCQKLRAQLKGALLSKHNKVYIKLFAEYNKTEMIALPILSWGGEMDHLYEMKQRGYLYEIDYVFNTIYIDSYVDLNTLFKKNVSQIIRNEKEEDRDTLEKIQNTVNELNEHISELSGIKEFEGRLTPEYKKFHDEGISVSIKSEIAIKGLYSNVIPYIKQDDDDNLYPTAGEGRKKLLAYSIYDILSDDTSESKINIFLIEEPENHLHKSMQIALSQILFNDQKYTYLFVTTHSPFVLYEMDNVNLVRIYNQKKTNSKSVFYKVPDDFEKNRKMLNRCLSEAIFANKVLLVEGPSEYILFNKVLSVIHPFYESDGIYILPVDGVGFEKYISILGRLEIFNAIKTDNDLRSVKNKNTFSVLGFSRCNNIVGKNILPTEQINENNVTAKRKLYNTNIKILDDIRNNCHIFLSKVDLENDLDEAIHDRLSTLLCVDEPVEYLQKLKHYNMVELVGKLTDEDCVAIYNHYNFACLKEVSE
ncbi:aAA domain protein [Clostridium sp. CAG:964]|nr:aAA domain protein [Clostridium sp. CAG:964]